MSERLSGALERALESNRGRYHARFATARRLNPALDEDAFGNVLQQIVAPAVEAVDQHDHGRTEAVVDALHEIALNLCAQHLLGPGSRYPLLATGWSQLLPRIPNLLAADPKLIGGAIANALSTLSYEPSARPQEWIERMMTVAPLCADVSTCLRAGQVVAWCSGMAHYRRSALALCREITPDVARAALGLRDVQSANPIGDVIDRLASNPWRRPSETGSTAEAAKLQIVKCAGAFRGFGGLFMAPPIVRLVVGAGDFVVSDGEGAWSLNADIFGATFHPISAPTTISPPIAAYGFRVIRGNVAKDQYRETFPELATVTSLAANETTLAATTALSHAVYLIAVA